MNKKPCFKRIIASILSLVIATAMLTAGISALADGTTLPNDSIPIAENLEISTYKNISFSGKLSAIDPDGDMVTFHLSKEPKKGFVEIGTDGSFIYTPIENKKGKDSFKFTATDSEGNTSAEATVSVKIKSQTTDICYADLSGTEYEYEALCLAENGVYVGEKIGSDYFFSPKAEVTRGEFLSMCMNMCGVKTLSGITETGFSDDKNIPAWTKPYVATALMAGIVKGYKDDNGNVVFSPSDTITYSEAVVMLDNVLDITDVTADIEAFSVSYPAWACQSVANLSSCNIISTVKTGTLTRGEAAKILAAATIVLENRDGVTSLFGSEY